MREDLFVEVTKPRPKGVEGTRAVRRGRMLQARGGQCKGPEAVRARLTQQGGSCGCNTGRRAGEEGGAVQGWRLGELFGLHPWAQ